MVELIVPPIIIVIILAALIILLTRAVRQAEEAAEIPHGTPHVARKKNKWRFGAVEATKNNLSSKLGLLKDKTQELAQKRRMTAAVEEARTNREEVQQSQHVVTETESYDQQQRQNMSPMGEIILNYRKDLDDPRGDVEQIDQESIVTTLIREVEENPQDPNAYEQLGEHFLEYQNFEDARECYKYILRLDPRHRRAQEAMKNLDRILT